MYKPQYCSEMYKNSWAIYHSGLGGTWSLLNHLKSSVVI